MLREKKVKAKAEAEEKKAKVEVEEENKMPFDTPAVYSGQECWKKSKTERFNPPALLASLTRERSGPAKQALSPLVKLSITHKCGTAEGAA
ncbi:MAG: hypothetical protein A2248_20315 [Candidatus Raymondbacteria bacterium RIFOXYA2_FULL_49_16]|nr:MAG: hypothetical protein A2248_20315 [Candidatus Raymondbacteria bacterium RIFOXYA2_FULL_49_16]